MNEKDLIIYLKASNWQLTIKEMKEYISKYIRVKSLKTGKRIKINTYGMDKVELRSIIINTLEQNY